MHGSRLTFSSDEAFFQEGVIAHLSKFSRGLRHHVPPGTYASGMMPDEYYLRTLKQAAAGTQSD